MSKGNRGKGVGGSGGERQVKTPEEKRRAVLVRAAKGQLRATRQMLGLALADLVAAQDRLEIVDAEAILHNASKASSAVSAISTLCTADAG